MGNAESSGDASKALYSAAKHGDTAEVSRLHAGGAGLEFRDAKGRTPLQVAVIAGAHGVCHRVRAERRALSVRGRK
jgi:hypothetical protein